MNVTTGELIVKSFNSLLSFVVYCPIDMITEERASLALSFKLATLSLTHRQLCGIHFFLEPTSSMHLVIATISATTAWDAIYHETIETPT